ncbi:hypothetical protein [Bacillus altitudinis]|uniref:hypothetical protein n=1 Tax=Bacillus altitudinis TaxID=293387 RepID=UPI0011A5116B|nr:hypothetical protein [Bacillus altitudinis]
MSIQKESVLERKYALEIVEDKFSSLNKLIRYTNHVIKNTVTEGNKVGARLEFPALSGKKETFLELADLVSQAGYTDVHLNVDDEKKNFVLSFIIY